MAKPQKENGFSPIANELLHALALAGLPSRFYQVIMAVFRFSYGFQKKVAVFGPGQLQKVTGISRQNLNRVIKSMVSRKIIDAVKSGYSWSITLNKNYENWIIVTRRGYDSKNGQSSPQEVTFRDLFVTPRGDKSKSIVTPGDYKRVPGGYDSTYRCFNKEILKEAEHPSKKGEVSAKEIEALNSEKATPEQVAKIRSEKFPKKQDAGSKETPSGITCPSCKKTAPDIHRGGKCPYCGKWV